MEVYEILLKAADEDITLEEANRLLRKTDTDILLGVRNVPTREELEAVVVGDKAEDCSGVCFMYHGVGKPEKMYVENGVFKDGEDTGFTPDYMAGVCIVGKDGYRKFKIDHDHLV